MEYFYCFITGGIICAIGQVLLDATKLTTPRVLVIFVVTGVVLEALKLYEPLVKFAGNGATLPLTGFGYALAKGAIEGAGTGFIEAVSGAVKCTAPGVATAIAFGYIVALIFEPKSIR